MDKAALIIYLATLIISPLLFGAVHTYGYTLMVLGVLSATVLLVIRNISMLVIRNISKSRRANTYRFQCPNTSLNVLFLLVLVFLILQVIPLPDFLLGFLSPEAKIVGEKSLPATVAGRRDPRQRLVCSLSILLPHSYVYHQVHRVWVILSWFDPGAEFTKAN